MSDAQNKPVPLAAYLQPRVSGARLERNRAVIQDRLQRPATPHWMWLTAAASCVLAATLLFVGPWSRTDVDETGRVAATTWSPTVGAALEARDEAVAVALADGSRLELEPQSVVAALNPEGDDVDLELRHGHVSFDVSHNPERRFRVHAGQVTVTVLGTRFSVVRGAGRIAVSVERGKVAVESDQKVTFLTPGQSWERGEVATGTPEETPVSSSPVDGVSANDGAEQQQTPPDDSLGATVERQATTGKNVKAAATLEEPGTNPAKQLFDASREARRSGDSRRAAELLHQLVAQYPRDPRAGLAAFELARIRADVLGDVGGAIQALEQALRLSPQGGFRQDALARLAQAYDRSGRVEACRATRQRYLKAYGEGVHAQRVLSLCP